MKNNYCRLCNSKDLQLVLEMPNIPPVDNFRYFNDEKLNYPSFPMDLYICKSCGHAQLLDIVDPDILFGNYIYTSSSSPDLDKHFTKYAEWLNSNFPPMSFNKVLDIGSNDGLFLSKVKSYGYVINGIDASSEIANIANDNNIPTLVSYFNKQESINIYKSFGKFNIITANNVYSHSNDLIDFTEGIINLLDDNGIFIFEVSYLLNLVNDKVIDYIYHEHLAHHSLLPLSKFLDSLELKLIDYHKINVKGGSIRCIAAHKNSSHSISLNIKKGIEDEIKSNIYSLETYSNIQDYFRNLSLNIIDLIKYYKTEKYIICSYGASATSIVLNSILKIDDFLEFIIDDNVSRQGRLSPTNKVPIISSEKLDDTFDKFLCIISAWRFSEIIFNKNKNRKGNVKFLVPLPHLQIIE
jgi:SAM-dependent methyltransferase